MSIPYTGMIGLTPSKPAEEEQAGGFSFRSYLDALFSGMPMQEGSIFSDGRDDEYEYRPERGYNDEHANKDTLREESAFSFGGRPPPRDSMSMTEEMLPGARHYVSKEDEWWYKRTAQQAAEENSLAMKSLDLDNTDSRHRIGDSFKSPAAPALNPYPSPFGPPRTEDTSPRSPVSNEATLVRKTTKTSGSEIHEVQHQQEDFRQQPANVQEYAAAEHARAALLASCEYERQQRHAAEAEQGPGDWLWGIFQGLTTQEPKEPIQKREADFHQVQAGPGRSVGRSVHPRFGYDDQDVDERYYASGNNKADEQYYASGYDKDPYAQWDASESNAAISEPMAEPMTEPEPSFGGYDPIGGAHTSHSTAAPGRNFEVQVGRRDTAGQIRDRVARAAGLPPSSIALAIGGQLLSDDAVPSLYESAKGGGSNFQLTVVAAPPTPVVPLQPAQAHQTPPPHQTPQPHQAPQPPLQFSAAAAEAAAAAAVAATPWLVSSPRPAKSAPVPSKLAPMPPNPATMQDTISTTFNSALLEDTQNIREAMASLTAELERRAAETNPAGTAEADAQPVCSGQILEPVAEHEPVAVYSPFAAEAPTFGRQSATVDAAAKP